MPAFNEEANIAATVARCVAAAPEAEVVVCDDCSADRTGAILRELQAAHPQLVVVTHTGKNQGYGRALRDAILASTGDWIATLDSDGQFAPEEINRFLEAQDKGGVDLVVGYVTASRIH